METAGGRNSLMTAEQFDEPFSLSDTPGLQLRLLR